MDRFTLYLYEFEVETHRMKKACPFMYEILMHKILRDERDIVPLTKIFVNSKRNEVIKAIAYLLRQNDQELFYQYVKEYDMLKNKRANIRRCMYMVFYLSENYVSCQMYEDLQRD